MVRREEIDTIKADLVIPAETFNMAEPYPAAKNPTTRWEMSTPEGDRVFDLEFDGTGVNLIPRDEGDPVLSAYTQEVRSKMLWDKKDGVSLADSLADVSIAYAGDYTEVAID